MKTIGLIGGMSWESTVTYYRQINERIARKLGGLHSARIVLYSVEFSEIEAYQSSGEWDKAADILSDAAIRLEQFGADFILLCSNTIHRVAPQIQSRIRIPLIHIAEATADILKEQGIFKVGLLGTRYTLEQDFYKARLMEAGIEVLIPDRAEIERINTVIFEELCLGIVSPESKAHFLSAIGELKARGAQCVILGCTEIGLLVSQKDTDLPLFDTTEIHAEKAAYLALID